VTDEAELSLLPRIVTVEPTVPEIGLVLTNGPSPANSRRTVPTLVARKWQQVGLKLGTEAEVTVKADATDTIPKR
jgi:hypothetical protein